VGAAALVLALAVLGLAAALAVTRGRGPDSPVAGRPTSPARPATAAAPVGDPEARALAVLRCWDRRRAAAWAVGSTDRLRHLYLPGSGAGTADARLLRAYRARGVRVVGLRTQVLALQVLDRAPGRLRLAVTDRLTGGRVVGATGPAGAWLPRDTATARVVTLVRSTRHGWQVAGVRDDLRSGRRRAGR
jgi:hypothetical protein